MKLGSGLFVALLFCACSSSSSSTAKKKTPPAPTYTPTAGGDPTGTPVTQNVDAAGGTVTSADGRLVVTIPAGAVSTSTAITIQPITDLAPNGSGDGYLLSPEGTTFAQPVTLAFQLSDAEKAAIAGELIATQHSDGLWYGQTKSAGDPNAGTVSVTTSHFSRWALVQTLQLKPSPPDHVRINNSATIDVTVLEGMKQTTGGDEITLPDSRPLTDGDTTEDASLVWAVNGQSGGTDTLGHISGATGDTDGDITGTYKAPGSVPDPSTVTVSLAVTLKGAKVIGAANLTIQADEVWNGVSDMTLTADGTKLVANFTMVAKPNDVGPTRHFILQDGVVTITPPTTTSNGCALNITPTTYTMGPNDGTMQIVPGSNGAPDQMTGEGTSVWPVTETVTCPSQGPQTIPTSENGAWWPFGTSGPQAPQPIVPGKSVVFDVSSALANGTVTMTEGG